MFQTQIIEKSSHIATKLRDICADVFDGDVLSISFAGKPLADLRSVDEGLLPEDGNYVFAELGKTNTASRHLVSEMVRALEQGKSLVIKDSSEKPVRGRSNRNLVVASPFLESKL